MNDCLLWIVGFVAGFGIGVLCLKLFNDYRRRKFEKLWINNFRNN
jgi:hypothetical protein